MYLDNTLIFSKIEEEYAHYLQQVLQVLRVNWFYAKMTKCHFKKDEMHYLGHVVGKEAIKMDPWNFETITKWYRPFEIGQL